MDPVQTPQPETPLMPQPAPTVLPTNTATPEPKKSHKIRLVIICSSVFLVFLFGGGTAFAFGVAYGKIHINNPGLERAISRFVLNLPFTPKTPTFLLESAAIAHSRVSKNWIDASVAIQSASYASTLGLSSIDADVKGGLDFSDPKNVKFSLNASITKDFNMDIRKKDATVYFKINKVPPLILTFLKMDQSKVDPILANWISYDTTPLDTEARKTLDSQATPKSFTDDLINKTINNLNDKQILDAIVVSKETVDSYPSYKLHLAATPAMVDLIASKISQDNKMSSSSMLYQMQPSKASDELKNLVIDMWIDQKDYYVRKIAISGKVKSNYTNPGLVPKVLGISTDTLPKDTSDGVDFAAVIKLSEFGKDITVATPSKSISFTDFYTQLLGQSGFYGSMSDANPIGINPEDQIKESRNARRLTDLAQTRKALDLALANATVTRSTPFAPNASSNSCIGTTAANGAGWIPYNHSVIQIETYIASLPKDPQNTGQSCYYFKAGADGTHYKLSVPLENAGSALSTMKNDGGTDPSRYEIGSDVTIR